jgi:enamine deaminase RidA (YjgF/YER057c/UK114 family)
MTEIIKVKTGSKFEDIGSYSRLVAIGDLIFVSNTAGRSPVTKEIPEDLTEQTRQVVDNVEAALAAVGASLADVVRSHVYVQNPQDIDGAMAVIAARFRGVDPALTITCPPLGSTKYKVELEVTAYRGAAQADVKTIDLSR